MDTQRICPNCKKPLAPDVPLGLCPECLIRAGFPTGAESEPRAESSFVPPTVTEMAGYFPQLEILEFIGKGGMGAVYKARQKHLDRIVALKILPPGVGATAGFAERFTREARALAKLNHPGIVTLFEFGEASGLYFFLMEFVDGVNLRQLLATRRIASREALAIVPQICDALQFAHDQGIVHRDIKPENILMDRRGRVKLADFGLAKLVGTAGEPAAGLGPIGSAATLTEAGKVMGTPNYMAPEQREHPDEVDNRADIYALGVVFYQMLTGELPGKPLEPPSRRSPADARLDAVVLRALEQEPDLRYQQASEIKTQVETIAGTPPAGAAPNPPARPSPLPPGKPGVSGLRPISGAAAGGGSTPPPGQIGALAPSNDGGSKVTLPAIGLMVAGIWKLFSALVFLLLLAWPGSWLGSFLSGLSIFPELHLQSLVLVHILLFKIVPAILIIFGAVQMLKLRSHAWATTAGILGILACTIIGFISGIWALIVLSQPEVRAAFNPNGQRPTPGRHSGAGVWILVAVILAILAVVGVGVAGVVTGISHLSQRFGGTGTTHGKVYQNIDLTLPLAPDGSFSLDNVNGEVTVTGWNREEVVVKGVKSGGSQQELDRVKADVESDTNHIVIHTRQTSDGQNHNFWDWFNNNNVKVDYTVQVPLGAHLQNVESVNGHIRISGVSGDITASTVNGETEVHDAAASLKLNTVNGHIVAELVRLGDGQSASFETVNGSIDVRLPNSADAGVSASTVNGGISSDFSTLVPEHEFPLGSRLNGTLGGGRATVHAETVNGAIHFRHGADPAPGAAASPPVVVETQPAAGAHDVAPGGAEIRVRFSKPMMDRSWSWSTAWENSEPEMIGDPHFEDNGRTCVIQVKLEPGKEYGYWINSGKFKNFQDRAGQPAIPYLLKFRTKNN